MGSILHTITTITVVFIQDTEKPTKPNVQNENINIKGNNKPTVKNKSMPNGTKSQNTPNKKDNKDLKK